jgi:hypothetical protein
MSLLLILLAVVPTGSSFVRATVPSAQLCLSAPSIPVTLENTYSQPLLLTLSVEVWHGDKGDSWLLVHEDMFRPEPIALNKVLLGRLLRPGEAMTIPWELGKRKGLPDLRSGVYRVVAGVSVPSRKWQVGSFEVARFELKQCGQ